MNDAARVTTQPATPIKPPGSGRRWRHAKVLRVAMAAVVFISSLTMISLAVGSSPADAECRNGDATRVAYRLSGGALAGIEDARRYNGWLSSGDTCDGDYQYVGSLKDMKSDGMCYVVQFNHVDGRNNTAQGINCLPTGQVRIYSIYDSNSYMEARHCRYNSRGGIQNCSPWRVQKGH